MTARSSTTAPHSAETHPAKGAADLLFASGVRHLSTRRIPEAMDAFEAALAANPAPDQQAAILHALGHAARRLGHARSAENFYGRALSLMPGRQEMLADLSSLYRSKGRYRDAQLLLEDALDEDPKSPELWLSLSHVLREIGDLTRARSFLAAALRLAPDHAGALGSMAALLLELGEPQAAQACAAQALRLSPFDARLRDTHARALLAQGMLAEGWHDFAHRLQAAGKTPRHSLPAWTGRAVPRKTLLLTAEPLLADQLLFASVIPDALTAAQARRTVIECEPALIPLFIRSFPEAEIRAPGTAVADLALALGDLPRLFRNKPDDFPAAPALKPDALEKARWRSALARLGPGPYIGLSWRGETGRGQPALRCAPLGRWSDFISRIVGTPICLQADATPEEIAALESESGRTVARLPGQDPRGTDPLAALLSSLDAVVSVPGPLAALAAALGTATLKLTFAGSWTSLGRDHEPLAPVCRIIRPDAPGDWDQVFARAADMLGTI